MRKIYATIIIYNKQAKNSLTLACFEKIRSELDIEIEIILVDNSNQKNTNDEFCKNNNIHYISMDGNVGLSKGYNAAINYINTLCDDYVMCIFDDDTTLTSDYFDKLVIKLKEKPKKTIYLPMIYDNAGLLSPCLLKGIRAKRAKNIDTITPETITGINTGMAVTSDVYRKIRYNQNMFLDYIDHDFIRNCKDHDYNIIILDTNLKQNFFDSEVHNFNTVFLRFKKYNKDYKIFCSKKKIRCFFVRLCRAIKLSFKHNNLKFVFHLFK